MKFERLRDYTKATQLKSTIKSFGIDINDLAERKIYIAGGTITSIFAGAPVRDLDLYALDKRSFEGLFDPEKFAVVVSTMVATTYKLKGTSKVTQAIKKFTGEPHEVLSKFDFTVCMGAYVPWDGVFVIGDRFFQDNLTKRLRFNPKAEYPIASMVRAVKYVKKGYHIPPIELIKIGLRCNQIKIKTAHDLKDQLMGVDLLITSQIMDKIREEDFSLERFQEELERHLERG